MAWNRCLTVALFFGAVVALGCGSAVAATLVINFDSDPIGNPIEDGTIVEELYAVLGVTFRPEGASTCGTNVYANADQPASFGSPPNVVSICASAPSAMNSVGAIRAILSQPASQVCIDVRPNGPTDFARLHAFNAGGAEIGSVASAPGVTQKLCADAAGIRGARFEGASPEAFARFDNFSVTFSSGPCEPQLPPLPPTLAAVDTEPGLVASVLPSSRSVQVGTTATAFATIINAGTEMKCGVGISLPAGVASLKYSATDCTSNTIIGAEDTPVNIAPGDRACYVIAVTPSGPFEPTELGFNYSGSNAFPVAGLDGINTLLMSASNDPVPDIIALAGTIQGDGIVHLPLPARVGAFVVATSNVGVAANITVSANTGDAVLPASILLCESNPATSACISSLGSSVTTHIGAGATPTFAIFVVASEPISLDPATKRIFVEFADGTGAVRGRTSVAVEAQ